MSRIETWMKDVESLAFNWDSVDLSAEQVQDIERRIHESGYRMPALFHEWVRYGKKVTFANCFHQDDYVLDPLSVIEIYNVQVMPAEKKTPQVMLGAYGHSWIFCSTDGKGKVSGSYSPHWPAFCIGTFEDLLKLAYEDIRAVALLDKLRKEVAPEFESTLDWYSFTEGTIVEERPDLFAPTFEDVVDDVVAGRRSV